MKASPEITAFWRFALPFALFIAAIGVLPHLLFSLNAGGLHYMGNARDEDAYTLYALQHHAVMYRWLGSWVVRTAVYGLGLDGGLIALDAIGPFLSAFIAAAICLRIGFRTRASMFMSSCLLLFALEFLALCNATMVGPLTQILPSASLYYPDWIRMFMPKLYENFFTFYKSPEPQVTLVIHFAALYLLLRHAQTLHWKYPLLMGALALTFPYIYVSTGSTLILCIGLYAAVGVLLTNKRSFWLLLAIAGGATAYYLDRLLSSGLVSTADGFIFRSRLPILSISMLWGGGLLFLYLHHWGRNLYTRAWLRDCPATEMLGLVCCALPFVTLNQQLITGMMVQSRMWEYYTNYMFVALGLLMMWPLLEVHIAPLMPKLLKQRAKYAATALLVLLVVAQLANFAKYTRANMDNLITAQLLEEQKALHPKAFPRLMLQATSEDAQMNLRMHQLDVEFIAGHQQTLDRPIAPLSAGEAAYINSQQGHEEAFTYFDRIGMTPDEFATKIDEESTKAMGSVIVARFFSAMDSAKPLSDYRNANVLGMKKKIPALITDYAAFVKNDERRTQLGEIWFATRQPHGMRTDVPWRESILASKKQGMFLPVTVTLYKMTPR